MSEALVFFALVCGGMVHSAAGFGSALVAMPILTLMLEPRVATPLQNAVGLTLSALIFYQHREKWPWRDSIPLIVFSILGVPLGTYAIKQLPESLIIFVLGLVLVGYAAFEIGINRWRRTHHGGAVRRDPYFIGGAVAGFLAGILGAAYATNGPPAIIYGSVRRWPKREFKSVLQSLFLVNGIAIMIWQGSSGLLNDEVGWFALFAFPGLVVGALIGSRIERRLNHEQFRGMVYVLLLVLGSVLLVRAAG